MMHKEIDIPCNDGFVLKGTIYSAKPDLNKRKVLIINSATAVSKDLYKNYALYMSDYGFDVLTYDYRGIAASRPKKLIGFQASFSVWGRKDFTSVLQYVKENYPNHSVLILGHSIGGTIIGMSKDCSLIDKIINIGAQTAYYKDWDTQKQKLYFLWHVLFPLLTKVFGYFPGKRLGLLEDVPKGVIKQWHARRKIHNMTEQLNKSGQKVYYHEFSGKLLTLAIEDDPIGTEKALKRIHDVFSSADKRIELVKPKDIGAEKIGHFGFFSRRFKTTLWYKTALYYDSVQSSVKR
ncbi:alpha/beta hydrolase [Flagellimonas hymeniacidonis]|uniref:Alpha/beta hydrolase n=1 Tax=Flagellimonas hymeniacidonis TaxID=2603628 RepID=A0A5C8V189_9FLAO|nr:alpha/beta fold hydrolase [Flagellimonas hymeniacidonis]TXN34852.1 alpha/beta hydrolase [Flagellimonas hymeniacidonis]